MKTAWKKVGKKSSSFYRYQRFCYWSYEGVFDVISLSRSIFPSFRKLWCFIVKIHYSILYSVKCHLGDEFNSLELSSNEKGQNAVDPWCSMKRSINNYAYWLAFKSGLGNFLSKSGKGCYLSKRRSFIRNTIFWPYFWISVNELFKWWLFLGDIFILLFHFFQVRLHIKITLISYLRRIIMILIQPFDVTTNFAVDQLSNHSN